MPSKLSLHFLRARIPALLLLSLLPVGLRAQAPVVAPAILGAPHRTDRILIIPKPGRAQALAGFHGQTGSRVLKAFPRTANIHVLEVPGGEGAAQLAERYRLSGHVEAVGLDWLFHPALAPNDPGYTSGDQWYLNNLGLGGGVADADIDAPEAWDSLRFASNTVVAVIDSGIRQTHQDLRANLWINPDEIPANGLDDDGNGIIDDIHGINAVNNSGNPEDDFGHGTHVSGILGAVGNNGVGVCGVAWQVPIMTCKFFYPTNGTATGSLSDLIQCLDYAIGEGAGVINCSIETTGFDGVMSNAFWSVRDAGIVLVAAAGNSGTDNDLVPRYPASFAMDNVVSVMATTSQDLRAGYNYGATTVDLGAPGSSILSTYFRSDSDYTYSSGTSMSTPCVAGAVALLRARFPSFDHRQIISRLLGTVDPLPSLAGRCVTGGRLNLAKALGTGDLSVQPATFAWVATNGMAPLTLANDGVSAAQPLPFTFNYYGRNYSQIYVGANGLIGFSNAGLTNGLNGGLPSTNAPNAVICPFWDDLNPTLAGNIWIGFLGTAPNRKAVVSWVDVPHAITSGGQTRYTFQAILHETRQIAFQYQRVESGRPSYVSGKSATIGVEDDAGALATEFAANAGTAVVFNNQAILFAPTGSTVTPSLTRTSGPQGGGIQFSIDGQPARTCVFSASTNLETWTSLVTNTLPASGTVSVTDSTVGSSKQKFYRAELRP
jgi:subtilisin family serine protease